MNAKRVLKFWSLPVVAGTIALASAHGQQEGGTEWNADPGTPGNGEDATCSACVPGADRLAGIFNARTVSFPAMGRET